MISSNEVGCDGSYVSLTTIGWMGIGRLGRKGESYSWSRTKDGSLSISISGHDFPFVGEEG